MEKFKTVVIYVLCMVLGSIISLAAYNPLQVILNGVTVGMTKSQLNSQYPDVPVGYHVMCPNIILGGAVYIKTTENGSNDVWQTVSAPPTL